MRHLVVAVVAIVMISSQAFGQAQLVPKEDAIKGATDKDVDSWNPTLAGTATVNMVSNQSVVGQVDGFSTLFGLGLSAGLDYIRPKHVLRNTLSIAESFARTPVIDEFVKTNDVIQFESLYNYFLIKRAGLFGRFSLQTSAFAAEDVRGEITSWVQKPRNDGDMPTLLNQSVFRQRLADPFKPLTINESVGVFAEPVQWESFQLSLRLGLGGRHTFASDVFLIDDDKATTEVEVLRLSDVHQLGVEAFAGAIGKLSKGKLTYRVGASALLPFVNNDEFERSASKLTRLGLEGALTFNVYEWMSVVYSLNVIRDPQLFPAGDELTQIQNNLLLTFKYTFIERKAPKPEPTKEEQELMDAKARAEAAEAARAEAEQRAKEAEEKLQQATPPAPVPEPAPSPAPAPTPAPTPTPAPQP
ncbi:MAG: hypothetical protein AB7O24_21300 [Kofleriaceae bacterium]